MAQTADAVIDALVGAAPGHRLGTRPIHAPGIAVAGWFQPSPVAAGLCEAEHFAGKRVPVTVRFSNGTGRPDEPDSTRAIRGMAVRFHLGHVARNDQGVLHSSAATDLLASTLPVFFTKTVADFVELVRLTAPAEPPPATRSRRLASAVARLVGTLRLLPPPPEDATAADLAAVAFADRHPPARLAVALNSLLLVPESYATCCYHAVHAFRLRAGDRTTAVRFQWQPAAGVRPFPTDTPPSSFLQEELTERLRRSPAEFVLRAQVAEAGDDTSDPTTPWSQARRRVAMGQLCLDTVVVDQVQGGERLRFDPTSMVPGIELCDDQILAARRSVYGRSAERRLADPPT